ncbi:MAG: hypothetical protein AAF802_06795 [Planctomycetota bacterium]
MTTSSSHLVENPAMQLYATHRRLNDEHVGRVLSFWWKLLLNIVMFCIPATMSLLLLPVLAITFSYQTSAVRIVLPVAMLLAFAVQIRWATCYPEWPMNRWLVCRLRAAWRTRLDADVMHSNRLDVENGRVAEHVPRDRWAATRLDTAADVMLVSLHRDGITLFGEHAIYEFPSASLIDIHVETVRPKGCFHELHFIVITARTEQGPDEIPIALRDYQFGALRSANRQKQTVEMAAAMSSKITIGSFTDPTKERNEFDQAPHQVDQKRTRSLNPYATPSWLG